MAQKIETDPAIILSLSSSFVKLRQGVSENDGRSHSHWNVTFYIAHITIVSLDIDKNEDELVYTFKSNFDLKGDADTANQGTLPEPSKYPLASASLLNKLASEFNKVDHGFNKLMRLRSRADSEERLYNQFLQGISNLTNSGRVKSAFKEFNQQRHELINAVMKDVQVVVTLPLNVKEMLRREFNPKFAIFDEASFFRDPEIFSVLGLLRGDARVLFVGDHKQLPPPVFTGPGEMAWGKSAFERLVDKKYHQTLLDVSYRSHRILYHPTSAAYYEGKVSTYHDKPFKNVRVDHQNPVLVKLGNQTWTLPGLSHFLHLAHVPGDTNKDFSGSLYHPREAELGIALARRLIDRGCRDVLIMSPYKAQVACVKKLWEQKHPNSRITQRVQTVDASQGSEAEAVIVLITRNFASAGFLRSTKWTNLMLSRARIAQYVVGNWDWVGGQSFKDGGKFRTYLDQADQVLDKMTSYPVFPVEASSQVHRHGLAGRTGGLLNWRRVEEGNNTDDEEGKG
ncbi:mitochondrial escape protein 2 [Aspergillus brasiliensis]|nr:mitochondrial escape protein 2 [Aspergillus brasiliensis]